jgi:biopolymer transport protein ExbD
MVTRAGYWLGTASILAALLMAVLVFAGFSGTDPEAMTVILPHVCSASEIRNIFEMETRQIFIRYMANGQSILNDEHLLPVAADLRRTLRGIMATRAEEVIYFEGDADLSYGEVDGLLRRLHQDLPELQFLLVTPSQRNVLIRERRRWYATMFCRSPQTGT